MTSRQFQQRALAFPEASEEPHFEKTSFRVRKKIFATLAPEKDEAVLKLPLVEQSLFTEASEGAVYPVPNRWGARGWTVVLLKKVRRDLLEEALVCAYRTVAPKSLRESAD